MRHSKRHYNACPRCGTYSEHGGRCGRIIHKNRFQNHKTLDTDKKSVQRELDAKDKALHMHTYMVSQKGLEIKRKQGFLALFQLDKGIKLWTRYRDHAH